jgi:hypothetical protein
MPAVNEALTLGKLAAFNREVTIQEVNKAGFSAGFSAGFDVVFHAHILPHLFRCASPNFIFYSVIFLYGI